MSGIPGSCQAIWQAPAMPLSPALRGIALLIAITFKDIFMFCKTGALLACAGAVISHVAFAQPATVEPSSGTGPQAGKDPFVRSREERAVARARYKEEKAIAKREYRKEKTIARQQYRSEKNEASQRLKASSVRADRAKNLDVSN